MRVKSDNCENPLDPLVLHFHYDFGNEWTKKEVNTRPFKVPHFSILRRELGEAATERLCEEAGLSYRYLIDENNWVSLEWLNIFYQKMVETTKNANSPYESGLLAATPEVWGSIYFLFRAVGSPALLYRKLCEITPDFNKRSSFEVVNAGRNYIRLRWHASAEHQYVCDNRRGQLAAVPMVWGLPPAEVLQHACCARGDQYCDYEIRWISRSRLLPSFAIATLVAVCVWVAAASAEGLTRWALVWLCATVGFLSARVASLLRNERDNMSFAQLQNEKLKTSMQELERKYEEIRKASQEIEDLNF